VRDHHVQGNALVPGVVALEAARAAAGMVQPLPISGFENVHWLKPLVVSDEGTNAMLTLETADAGLRFKLRTAIDDVHVTGLVLADIAQKRFIAQRADIEAIRSRCPRRMDSSTLYTTMESLGVCYGPRFRGLESLWQGSGESLAKLEIDADTANEFDLMMLHPSVLDAALQAVAGAFSANAPNEGMVPFSADRIDLTGNLSSAAFVWCRQTSASDSASFDISIMDTSGSVLVHINGLSLRRLPTAKERAADRPLATVASTMKLGFAGFYGILVSLAFAEEMVWDRLVWHAHPTLFGGTVDGEELGRIAKAVVVPLLAVPQATHYILDAVLWRSKDARSSAVGFARPVQ